MLQLISMYMHAAAKYPGGTGWDIRSLPSSGLPPTDGGLPRFDVGSASATTVSRPARRSLRIAACMLAESPRDPFLGVLQLKSLPPSTAPSATGRSDRGRVGISPTENHCLITAHVKERCGMQLDIPGVPIESHGV